MLSDLVTLLRAVLTYRAQLVFGCDVHSACPLGCSVFFFGCSRGQLLAQATRPSLSIVYLECQFWLMLLMVLRLWIKLAKLASRSDFAATDVWPFEDSKLTLSLIP